MVTTPVFSGKINESGDYVNDRLTTETQGDTLLVYGDIDLHQVQSFRTVAEAHIEETANPRIDLTGVPFLDSAGLATLVYLVRQARSAGKTLRLIATGSPRRVLRITGIDQMLTIED